MKIALASGKGGTGKTTMAVALARAARSPVRLLDCDVEGPNCHLFIKPVLERSEIVTVSVPVVDKNLCKPCGKCAEICRFNAIASIKLAPLFFPELCHACGGCIQVCPENAIGEIQRDVGLLECGSSDGLEFIQGRLMIGEAMATPVIKAVKRYQSDELLTLIDCPPGTACPFAAAVRGCDYVLLVTEPTPFGLHDLKLAVATLRRMGIAAGVIVNRCVDRDNMIAAYCREENIPLHLQVPEQRRIAEASSRGRMLLEVAPEFGSKLREVLQMVTERISGGQR
ncbi:MAG: P-loop NTPase [bacterium]|nr:P-loop NTPase [bacterium]